MNIFLLLEMSRNLKIAAYHVLPHFHKKKVIQQDEPRIAKEHSELTFRTDERKYGWTVKD